MPDDERKQTPDRDQENEAEPPPDPVATARRKRRNWIIAGIVGVVLLIGAVAFGSYWWTTLRWFESTDDAYTQADAVVIAPKIAGYVAQLRVTDNQRVKSGEELLQIDPRDYQASVDQAQADVASAEAALAFSQQENARYQALAKTEAGTVQRAQQAQSDLRAKRATLQHNRAVLDQARLNLGYTVVKSPTDGAVGDRSVREGQYVQPGERLMSVVPMGSAIYVVANFKETQIGEMFRGERVDLSIDTFPHAVFAGKVDSLAPGSGAQFALLPPENATGNFTKIVQRIPVKILIDKPAPDLLGQLRPGLSVVADVDTRTAPPGQRQTLVAPGTAAGPVTRP